jgi:hypothetical protein
MTWLITYHCVVEGVHHLLRFEVGCGARRKIIGREQP